MAILLKEGRVISFEIVVERLDGTKRFVIPHPKPIYDAKGKIVGAINTLIDFTAQIEVRRKVEESEERFRNLIEQAINPILILKGEDLTLEIANEPLLKIWGVTNEAIGKPFLEILPSMVDQPFLGLLKGVLRTGIPYYGYEREAYFIHPDGQKVIRYFDFVYQPYRETDGKISGVLVLAIDVTERVLANEAIKEREAQFSILANNVQNLAWMANADGWIYWYNNRWYEYTGTTPEQMEGWGWQSVHDPEKLPAVLERWKISISSGQPFDMVFPLKGADGVFRPFLTRVMPIQNSEGKVIRWIGTNTDITEQKKQEEELEKAVASRTYELQRAAATLEEKNIELKKMNQELEAFAYVSSHDLQEPLRKIKTFASIIQEKDSEALSDSSRIYFSRMQDAAARMQQLIEDLLTYSRTSLSELKFEKILLSSIIEQVKTELKELIEEKHATIEVKETGEVNINPFQFRQLMSNLISNALKFSKPQIPPRIIIKNQNIKDNKVKDVNLSPDKEYSHISITDNGIGFDKEYREKSLKFFNGFTQETIIQAQVSDLPS